MPVVAQLKNSSAKTKDQLDILLGIFKKKVKNSGILIEYIDKQRFKKPSEKLRYKRNKAKFLVKHEKNW